MIGSGIGKLIAQKLKLNTAERDPVSQAIAAH
jgi:hypothetical protein